MNRREFLRLAGLSALSKGAFKFLFNLSPIIEPNALLLLYQLPNRVGDYLPIFHFGSLQSNLNFHRVK